MTPTEQDNKLRERIEIDWLWLTHTCSAAEQKSVDRTLDKMMQLITADRKRVALEARAATLDALDNHKKTLNYIVKDGAPRNHTNYEVYMSKAIEVDTKIAELKAQQEEFGDS